VDREAIRALLEDLRAGRVRRGHRPSAKLRDLPYEGSRVSPRSTITGALARRRGPKAVLLSRQDAGAGGSRSSRRLAGPSRERFSPQRADRSVADAGGPPPVCRTSYHSDARLVIVRPEPGRGSRPSSLCSPPATADLPVAEEAALVAEALGQSCRGVSTIAAAVAGLHRLLAHYHLLAESNVNRPRSPGWKGALPSVVGGSRRTGRSLRCPPASGTGASFGGIAALLAMLNSWRARGVSVVNIDNGYGAAHQASQNQPSHR